MDTDEKDHRPFVISSIDFEEASTSNENGQMCYDPNRRTSLGGESQSEHDVEDAGLFTEYSDSLASEFSLGYEYAEDIFLLARQKECIDKPFNYMEQQPQITEFMRCTLINWLLKVNRALKFGPETVFIAVHLTDRFLALTPIAHDCLQLVAVCALAIAAKLEEMVAPTISALVSLCGSTYKPCHFRKMEVLILSTLQFRLHSATSWYFVTYIVAKASCFSTSDRNILNLTRFVTETCLGSYRISLASPSHQAVASLILSCLVIHVPQMVYPFLLEEDKDGTGEELVGVDVVEMLSRINNFSSSLLWTFKNIFPTEELKEINDCFYFIKEYLKSFISGYTPVSLNN